MVIDHLDLEDDISCLLLPKKIFSVSKQTSPKNIGTSSLLLKSPVLVPFSNFEPGSPNWIRFVGVAPVPIVEVVEYSHDSLPSAMEIYFSWSLHCWPRCYHS